MYSVFVPHFFSHPYLALWSCVSSPSVTLRNIPYSSLLTVSICSFVCILSVLWFRLSNPPLAFQSLSSSPTSLQAHSQGERGRVKCVTLLHYKSLPAYAKSLPPHSFPTHFRPQSRPFSHSPLSLQAIFPYKVIPTPSLPIETLRNPHVPFKRLLSLPYTHD